MDPKNEGLEDAFPFNYGIFLLSMLVFGSGNPRDDHRSRPEIAKLLRPLGFKKLGGGLGVVDLTL